MGKQKLLRDVIWLVLWVALAGAFGCLQFLGYDLWAMPGGHGLSSILTIASSILAGYRLGVLAIRGTIKLQRGAPGEVDMLAGVLRVVAGIGVGAAILTLFGQLETVGTALGAFSGLLLGWSLQAPVSGMAAWVMISLKRPFRVGDRIQLPSLGLVGDVVSVGPMYTTLNQVGGAVGSEEAVGRPILVPNAMLFGNVVINYTARQDAAFILDEVVIRITYDTDWEEAEQILLAAACEVTREVIAQTGQEPYVRADMYDYGVYMRLRFMTLATDRPRITYEIVKRISQDFQRSARVDFAIPYIYSFRKGVQASARHEEADVQRPTMDVPLGQIVVSERDRVGLMGSEQEIGELATRIQAEGLMQPVVLDRSGDRQYQVAAGHMRVEACKRLGWRSLPAIIRGENTHLWRSSLRRIRSAIEGKEQTMGNRATRPVRRNGLTYSTKLTRSSRPARADRSTRADRLSGTSLGFVEKPPMKLNWAFRCEPKEYRELQIEGLEDWDLKPLPVPS